MIDKFKFTDSELKELLKSQVILVDTREKVNEHITTFFDKHNIPYKRRALNQGDYSFYLPANEQFNIPRDLYFDKEVIIERKASLDELANNFGKERDRFEKEMSLAPSTKILLIENCSYEDIIANNYKSNYDKKSFLGTLHSFQFRYNMPFIFMKDRTKTPIYIKKYFEYYLREYLR